MSLKIGLNLERNYSINFDLPKRSKKLVKFIIIHYTGMKKQINAIKRLCDSRTKVSTHYFIKNNGKVLKIVPDLYTAWHAGQSEWKNFKSLNKYSIGIEINNPGHSYGYKNFSSNQIISLSELLKYLIKKYNINKKNVLGHSDISPNRKKDPGEKFPWKKLASKGLCLWHRLDEKKILKYRNKKLMHTEEKVFLNYLYKFGYSKLAKSRFKLKKKELIKSFQRRFRQSLVNGKIDQECFLIVKNIIKS